MTTTLEIPITIHIEMLDTHNEHEPYHIASTYDGNDLRVYIDGVSYEISTFTYEGWYQPKQLLKPTLWMKIKRSIMTYFQQVEMIFENVMKHLYPW